MHFDRVVLLCGKEENMKLTLFIGPNCPLDIS